MNSFLHDVARSLFDHYGDRLADLDVVFASRRAIRYFNGELAKIGAPAPKCHSMDSWIAQLSDDMSVGTRFVLCAKLFEIYLKYHPEESFDRFYSFGNLLISDFDMIDRYMVDARTLYSIVSDTRDIESVEGDLLRNAAVEFWSHFDESGAERHKQQEFLRVWRSLYDIYVDFNKLLEEQKITYSGRIYRRAAENFDASKCERHTVFIGLNALSTSEKEMLSKLNEQHRADFIWDYDPRWIEEENSECGYFISHNIKHFDQATYFKTSIRQPQDVKIEVIETPSDVAQCKILPQLLDDISSELGGLDERVAIILTDEKLLLPLLYSLPKTIGALNISMGYPLRATLAYRFVEMLIRLQRRVRAGKFYASDVMALLSHPYLAHYEQLNFDKVYLTDQDLPSYLALFWKTVGLNYRLLHGYIIDCLAFIAAQTEDPKELQFIDKTINSIQAVGAMFAQTEQELSVALYLSLMAEVIGEQSIEFDGVSGRGLQIIGILESRALDFERVIILSMTDDNFPSSRPDSSYIPQLLLQGYGMPTIAEKSAIWSYYFYRLLQRPTKVDLLYCNVADGMTTGEQSRYISQLEYCSDYQIDRVQVSTNDVPTPTQNSIVVNKDSSALDRIGGLCYYPTMFFAYRNCPLSFYFSAIEKIAKPSAEDEQITAADSGNVLHQTMQALYRDFCGQPNVVRLISTITEAQIFATIDRIMREALGEKLDNEPAMASIVRLATRRMVKSIIAYDLTCDDLFSIEAIECRITGKIAGFDFAGVIDRVDRLRDGSIRIIDYKTGSVKSEIASIEQLLDERDTANVNSVVLQMLIYSFLARMKWSVDIAPAIYAVRQMSNGENSYSPSISIAKEPIIKLQPTHYEQIEEAVANVFARMCDVVQPFVQTERIEACQYCNFAPICRR